MSTRVFPSAIILGVIVSSAFACSNQPNAPSSLNAAQPVDSVSIAPSAATSQSATGTPVRFGDRTPGVVFVTSQGLYYDTFAVKDPLPMKGRFQLLTTDGQTEFGPGQPGYLGGRWWQDLNSDGLQDPNDHYFLCPLLPPGRQTP
jgi:hypothetical protein